MTRAGRLGEDARGATAVEFALVAPTFLALLFLLLDGGRMLFTKQALNELAAASARCAALKPAGCVSTGDVQGWAVSRGLARSRLKLTVAMVTVSQAATCNSVSGMARVTIAMPYRKSMTTLLPQSATGSSLTATSCFPMAGA